MYEIFRPQVVLGTLISLFVVSCSARYLSKIVVVDSELNSVLTQVFSDTVFSDYRSNKVLNIECRYPELISECNQIKNVCADTAVLEKGKYIYVDYYFRSKETILFQFYCVDTLLSYNLIYSTSFRFNYTNHSMELISEVSPYIDTLWIADRK